MKKSVLLAGVLCVLLSGGVSFAQSNLAKLENPVPDSHQSGISVISGWVCAAQEVVIEIDGLSLPAAYGTLREDTADEAVCGDTDNGFSLLWNWSNSGDGVRTVRAFADGTLFAETTVTVTTFGRPFLAAAPKVYPLANFPTAEEETRVQWEQSLQNFVIRDNPTTFTRDFVQAALDRYDRAGRAATVAYYNDPANIEGQWYVFMIDEHDQYIVHPVMPALLGRDIKTIVGSDGYELGKEIARATEAGHWIHYLWHNPATGQEEPKHSWAIRHDGIIFVSGYYDSPADDNRPPAFTRGFVRAALNQYDRAGRAATVAYHNDPANAEGQWYVFMIDEDDRYIAHPFKPSLLGRDIKTIVGSDGYELGKEIARATETGHWIHYLWPNPVTGQEEPKHSWAIRHDGIIFVSGYYDSSADGSRLPPVGHAQVSTVKAVLENPAPGSFHSGIAALSGWACEAKEIVIEINGVRLPAAYGTTRGDTAAVCGDTDNGFSLLWNWNTLGDGVYTVRAFIDGTLFARTWVTVTTLGAEMFWEDEETPGSGTDGPSNPREYELSGFPVTGAKLTLQWSPALQNFVITDVTP